MDRRVQQNIRELLDSRIAHVTNSEQAFWGENIKLFVHFVETHPVLKSIIDSLFAGLPGFNRQLLDDEDNYQLDTKTFEESVAISYLALRKISQNHWNAIPIAMELLTEKSGGIHFGQPDQPTVPAFNQEFLEKLYRFLQEKIEDQAIVIELLINFKQRSEWFTRQYLNKLSKGESRKAENLLAQELYLYLYDAGVDISIEPSSPRGKIDLIAAQKNSNRKLFADAKIFDAESHNKRYLLTGFRQIYTYCQQYNENIGYLVIFKLTDRDLDFALPETTYNLPSLTYNNKTIAFLTIDIHSYEKPVSQREPLRAISITQENLIQIIEDDDQDKEAE